MSTRPRFPRQLLVFISLLCGLGVCSDAQDTGGAVIVVSAASYAPVVAPLSLASVFTRQLENTEYQGAELAEDGTLPLQLGGVSVRVDNSGAGIVGISSGRVDFVMPAETLVGKRVVEVFRGDELLVRGEAEVGLTAPAVFSEDGSGRGPALARNAITGQPGPFRVFTSQPGAGSQPTEIRLVATGLRFAGNPDRNQPSEDVAGQIRARLLRATGAPVTLPVVRCQAWSGDLTLDRTLPAPRGVGIDELVVTVPSGVAGTGDTLLLIETDEGVSKPVVVSFRPTPVLAVTSVTPSQVRPGEAVTIRGTGFATQEAGIQSRNFASLQAVDGRLVPLLVLRAAASTMDALVLPAPSSSDRELFVGRTNVCVETDSESACSRGPILEILPVEDLGVAAGEKWLEYLQAFHAQLLALSEGVLPPKAFSRLREEILESEARNRNLVDAARAGIPEVQRIENVEDGRTVEFWFDEAFYRTLDASVQKVPVQQVASLANEIKRASLSARWAEGDCGLTGETFALEAKRLRGLIDKGEQVLSITVAVIDGILAAQGCATAVACSAALQMSTILAGVAFWAPFADIVELEYNNTVLLESLQVSPATVTVNPRTSAPFTVHGRFVSRQGHELLFDFAKRLVFYWLEGKLNAIGVVKKGQIVESVLGRAVNSFIVQTADFLVNRTVDNVREAESADVAEIGSRSLVWCCTTPVPSGATLQLANVNPCRSTSATGVQASSSRALPYSVFARSEVLWLHEFADPPWASVYVRVTTVPTLQKLTVPPSVTGGSVFQGRIELGAAAPDNGFTVSLRFSSSAAKVANDSVRVQPGATSANFEVTTTKVTAPTTLTVTATAGNDSLKSELTLVPPLPAPSQISPASGTWFRNDPFPRNMKFAWTPVTGASAYRVELDYFCTTWEPWVSAAVNGTSYDRAFVGSQPGRWRVAAQDAAGVAGEASPWWGFDFSPNPALLSFPASTCKAQTNPALAPPTLNSPAEGATFSNVPRTLTLRWNSVPGISRYGVQVDYGSGSSWSSDSGVFAALTTTDGTSLTVTFVGAQPGRWRVWAIDEFSRHGPKSAWRNFRYLR